MREPVFREVLVTAALSGHPSPRPTYRAVLGHDEQGREVVSYYQRYYAIAPRAGRVNSYETVAVVKTFTREI